MFPVLPFGIVTVVCGVFPLDPVHPLNVYPVFVGFINVNVSVSTVYVSGLFPFTLPPFKSYSIDYAPWFHLANNVLLVVIVIISLSLYTLAPDADSAHPSNAYPFLVNTFCFNSVAELYVTT